MLNPKNIAELTQRAMELGAERMKNNQQADKKFPRPILGAQERSESGSNLPREFGGDLLKMFSSLKTPTSNEASSVGIVPSSSGNKKPRQSDSSGEHFNC